MHNALFCINVWITLDLSTVWSKHIHHSGVDWKPTRPPDERPGFSWICVLTSFIIYTVRVERAATPLRTALQGRADYLRAYRNAKGFHIFREEDQKFLQKYPWLEDGYLTKKHEKVYLNNMNAYKIACETGEKGRDGVAIVEDDLLLAKSARERLSQVVSDIKGNENVTDEFVLDGYVVWWTLVAPNISGPTYAERVSNFCCTQFIFLSSSELACRIYHFFEAHSHAWVQADETLGWFSMESKIPWLVMYKPIVQHMGIHGTNLKYWMYHNSTAFDPT
ncbi:hypothetical protein CYMTET_43731 [Cymbomonas tetramitiformis]|uniref:Uncharacterized protein n=1 Tax=Cymbomonas tetramitiformis TaxID=36881 RepID=A0AAE0C1N0_9CHLO|nr:hypothetical protein CYMTET_43731 [Cymbomonas tetramitiformis]